MGDLKDVGRKIGRRVATLARFARPNSVSAFWRLTAPVRPIRSRAGRSLAGMPSRGTLDDLIDDHFAKCSTPDHPNRGSLARALGLLAGRPANILETGSSAWGTNSSRLFDRYVRRYGGRFLTIDIRPAATRALRDDVG